MNFDLIKELSGSRIPEFDENEMSKLEKKIFDCDFIDFFKKTNGGSILYNSLNFYGIIPQPLEVEIFYNNYLFSKYYSEIFPEVFVFAEDIFGNQFAFLDNNNIGFLNIESGVIENMFKNFVDFVSTLSNSLDYFSGFTVAEEWATSKGLIKPSERLCPIKPFVIGGDYTLENLHLMEKEQLFDYSSFIARQIKDLPDGTNIILRVE